MDWNKAGCRHKLNAILRLVVVAKICRDLCSSSLAGFGQVPSSVLTTLEMFKREFSVIIAWNTLSWSHILHCTPLYPRSRGLDLIALLNDRITTLWVPLSLIFSFQLPISDAANQPVWQSGFCWGSHPTATLVSIPHPAKPAGRAAPSLLTDTSPAHLKCTTGCLGQQLDLEPDFAAACRRAEWVFLNVGNAAGVWNALTFLCQVAVGLVFLNQHLNLFLFERRVQDLVQAWISLLQVDEIHHLVNSKVGLALGTTGEKLKQQQSHFNTFLWSLVLHLKLPKEIEIRFIQNYHTTKTSLCLWTNFFCQRFSIRHPGGRSLTMLSIPGINGKTWSNAKSLSLLWILGMKLFKKAKQKTAVGFNPQLATTPLLALLAQLFGFAWITAALVSWFW